MRIAHLSDLHFGRHDEGLAAALSHDVGALAPDLVVVSGDFTQIGSTREFDQARAFLDALRLPVFAVPGNHDVPARDILMRLLLPYRRYKRAIAPGLEPFLEAGGVALAGLKTSRRMRLGLNWAHGSISRDQIEQLERRFAAARPDAVRIVVAHHPLLQPEAAVERPMRRVDRADLALAAFARLGVRAVLSGHFHLSYVRRHVHPGAIATGEPSGPRQAAAAPLLVVQAASAISTRLRGHANAYNVLDVDGPSIAVRVREWTGTRWTTRETGAAPPVSGGPEAPAP